MLQLQEHNTLKLRVFSQCMKSSVSFTNEKVDLRFTLWQTARERTCTSMGRWFVTPPNVGGHCAMDVTFQLEHASVHCLIRFIMIYMYPPRRPLLAVDCGLLPLSVPCSVNCYKCSSRVAHIEQAYRWL